MNREIKFRCWDGEKMSTPFKLAEIFNDVPEGYYGNAYVKQDGYHFPLVNDIMQYTGLKDKNGKEIYEGDILRSPHFVDGRGKEYFLFHEIMWDEKHTGWKAVSLNNAEGEEITAHGNPQLWVYMKNEGAAIVWANIYENPELLSKEQNVKESVATESGSSNKAG